MSGEKLLVLQGGGPTPVMNACLGAIIEEARNQTGVNQVLGVRHGTPGLVAGDFTDLTQLPADVSRMLAATPGAFLGSSRYHPTDEEWGRAAENLRAVKIAGLILMGGNGSMRAAHRLGGIMGDDLRIVAVPATVDNDIPGTDRCPGYASAARFVAHSVREVAMDVQSLPLPVTIFETMGRDSGWLAGSAWLARHEVNPAPHRVYLPERAFEMDRFLGAIQSAVDDCGWAMAVVSEGIRDRNGDFVFRTGDPAQADHGGRTLPGDVASFLAAQVAGTLNLRCRSEKPGLCGRTSMAHVSPVDREDSEAVGREAVRSICRGESGHMIGLQPRSNDLEEPKAINVPLPEAIKAERPVPEAWLGDEHEPGESFLTYLRSIIGPDLPDYPHLC
jgi:6-phosphofructokinase 1